MAVVTRPCSVFPCVRINEYQERTAQNGGTLKSACDFIKSQLCTAAISLTLFNSARLPREAFRHGAVPYLVVYSFWLVVVGLPTVLLQLAMGQLSQQDTVGVWRAVPILKGVGHLKVITSYMMTVYNMMIVALSAAYLIWIGKGSFPLRDCTRLHLTPTGYQNKMNASECFNATFLSPFTVYPQYLGIMAILIFIGWFFLPILLFRLRKSLKVALTILAPLIVILTIVLCTFVSKSTVLRSLFMSCEQWMQLTLPYIWHSALVQALLSSQIASGYLVSAGSTIYRHSDVRWNAVSITTANLITGWLWVLFWESIGGYANKDTSFIAVLVLVYQSSVSQKRTKEWPLLAFGIIFVSGIVTILLLLYPIYDKLHRAAGDNWRLFAAATSALGTVLTVAVLIRRLEVATVLDELAVPVLVVFTTALEVVGFVFIYGWCYLNLDIEFLTGTKLCFCWVGILWMVPVFLFGVTGWWLRTLLRSSWGQNTDLWPLVGVFVGILVVMLLMAAISVAKEEQFNLCSKIASAFHPSRQWGPEEPMARYIWMSQRQRTDTPSILEHDENNYAQIIFDRDNEKKFHDDWTKQNEYQKTYYVYTKTGDEKESNNINIPIIIDTNNEPKIKVKKKDKNEYKFRSPNVCIAKDEIGGPINCNCNRHFTLNVPDLRKTLASDGRSEVTTSL